MKPGRWVAAVSVGAVIAMSFTPLAAQASGRAHTTTPNPLANPSSNTVPSTAFSNACQAVTASKKSNDKCDAAALKDFDKVRAGEGLGPMTLPRDFDVLKVPAQLLVISDIERVDRGLAPMLGLSSTIDDRAQTGADNDEDPPFPAGPVGDYESSNWAGGFNSALLVDFAWMYDDGYGSSNEDCTSPDDSACWGHRDDILGARSTPLLMGAAVAYGTQYGTSMAEQFIGGDTSDTVDVSPSWATILTAMPLALSAKTLTVVTHSAKAGRASLTARSRVAATITVKVTAGTKYWTVTPTSCHVAAGKSCTLHVHFRASKRGTHDGVLRVTGSAGAQHVTLIGHRKAT